MTSRNSHYLILILFFVLGTAACGTVDYTYSWELVEQLIEERYPNVSHLTTADLAAKLSETETRLLLLDARAPEEYAVSHLRGAQLATDLESATKIALTTPADTLVVIYCSVGLRSSNLANQLKSDGISNVYNLKGSIFAWINEGRKVYQGDTPVTMAHPYDDDWGQLLEKRFWSTF